MFYIIKNLVHPKYCNAIASFSKLWHVYYLEPRKCNLLSSFSAVMSLDADTTLPPMTTAELQQSTASPQLVTNTTTTSHPAAEAPGMTVTVHFSFSAFPIFGHLF